MEKKFYITTSIPYTNAAPHIGFALEIIQADALARYQRGLGKDIFFLTGTDEHGIKTKKAAEAADKTLEEFLNEVSGRFQELGKTLNITTNSFIRTTDSARHLPAVVTLWQALEKKGDLYKKKYEGYYCIGHEVFHPENELVNGECPAYPGKKLELVQEENYFFKLSKYLPEVKRIIEHDVIAVTPASKKNEILQMIDNGLEDVSFSRAKEKYWGIPVPGDDSQVIYVWADALPNYISAIGYATDEKQFKTYWPADVHCIGKDIIKFHLIYWPAMLLSLGLELPKSVFVHGFITVGGQKMSKSLGNVIDPFELVRKYGTDAVRYYLLREILPTEDGDFTIEKFEQRYNSDLAGGIGNLLARTLALAAKPDFLQKGASKAVVGEVKKTKEACDVLLEEYKFNEALKSIWDLISFFDGYINREKPWEWKENASETVSDCLYGLGIIADLLLPFLPETAEKIKHSLKEKKPIILFPRLLTK